MDIKPEYYIVYDVGDKVYTINNGIAIPIEIQEIRINKNGIQYCGTYLENGSEVTLRANEKCYYRTAAECEKAYILKKYGHLFKDTKTLK